MKTSIKTFFSVLFLATILSSCNANMFNSVNGNNNVLTENRSSKADFTKITISTGLDLYITQGSKNEIVVEADENLHDIIFTEINDGVLKIYSEKNIWRAEAKKIHVTIKNLEAITLITNHRDPIVDDLLQYYESAQEQGITITTSK